MVAPRILWRYILWDILLYTSLGLSLFTILLLVQNTLRFLEELLAAGVGLGGLARLMSIILPTYFSYALPTSLLLGVLLAFGRMSADGEIVAMRASGVSVWKLLPPVIVLGTATGLVTTWLLFELEPRSHQRMKRLVRELASSVELAEPREFRSLGEHVIYVHGVGREDCPLEGVLIGDFSDPRRSLYVAARCGRIDKEQEGASTLQIALEDGSIHFTEAETDRYRRIAFASMHTGIDLEGYLDRAGRVRDQTMATLFDLKARFERGEKPFVRDRGGLTSVNVEIHRRIAFPFACVFLVLLAVPLGIRPLRSGRSAGALTAIGLMGLYWVLFTAGRVAGENAWIPPWLGVWSANLFVVTLGIWLIRRSIRGDA